MDSERVVQRWDDETVLIDLGGLTRVKPRRSLGPALVLAVFTLLTCAGLAMSGSGSRSATASRAEQGAARASTSPAGRSGPDPGPPTSVGSMRVSDAGRSRPASVAVGARAIRTSGGSWTLRLTGVADPAVGSIEVAVRIGAVVVATGVGRIDPPVTLAAADGPSGPILAPWSAELAIAPDQDARTGDAVAIVDVRWLVGSRHDVGVTELVVSLGDGRASD
jgi:hypothetical protein